MNVFLESGLTLNGQYVALEPLQEGHADALCLAAADGELWNLSCTIVPNAEAMAATIAESLSERNKGDQFPFVVRHLADKKIIGATRYYDIKPAHRTLSIGYTWYAKSAQRTAVNTECKFLLLKHAFDSMACMSVAFHVDDTNHVSQAAVQRLGATFEGVLRNHRIMPDGRIRNTHCYSIIDSEWPEIEKNLVARLNR